jgi:hypothetical protein
MSIRQWIWKDPDYVLRMEKYYRTPRHLTDADLDFLNENYHILINDPHRDDWYSVTMKAISQVGIDGIDWWYANGVFVFTHESDKALVYLTTK